jgi:hypothetical protein
MRFLSHSESARTKKRRAWDGDRPLWHWMRLNGEANETAIEVFEFDLGERERSKRIHAIKTSDHTFAFPLSKVSAFISVEILCPA